MWSPARAHVLGSLKYYFVLFIGCSATAVDPLVELNNGVLKGSWQVSSEGVNYASFRGIPYAQPPIGKNRFRNPQPLKPWLGVWDATQYQSPCLQYDNFPKVIKGNEDCLYLNVYTPNINTSLPVVVYIHGGGFMSGSSNIVDPINMMNKDLVFVSMNYRLGPLGFLSTGDSAASGNFGLKDQAIALKWVRDNINKFGGNPDLVTLSGESAGGSSVHYHYISPWSNGLFKAGIAHSGVATTPWAFTTKATQRAKTLAAILGCPTDITYDLIACLKTRPAENIVKAQIPMFSWKTHLFSNFVPSVEGADVENPFLTKSPYQATVDGEMRHLPLILSVTADEGLYPAAAYQAEPELLTELDSNWTQLASLIFEYNDTLPAEKHRAAAEKIKDHYLDQNDPSEDFSLLVNALSDRHFKSHVGEIAEMFAYKSTKAVYLYHYGFRGSYSLSNELAKNNVKYGVSHGDDVLHLFSSPTRGSEEDAKMTQLLVNMVYSFASTGVPKFGNSDPEWIQVTPAYPLLDYMNILSPSKLSIKSSSNFGQKLFWNSLGLIENGNYNDTAAS